MSSRHVRLAMVAAALMVGACSSGGGGGGATNPPLADSSLTATSLPEPTAVPTATPAPSPSEVAAGGGDATPPAIDPCTLLTQDEASKIIGLKLGPGVSQQLDPDRACTWKDGLSEVRLILAPPAPDTATAQAYWDAERSQIPEGISIKELTYFDRSAYVTGSAAGASLSALFVIDGRWFYDLYCGFPACSEAASVGGADHISGRLR